MASAPENVVCPAVATYSNVTRLACCAADASIHCAPSQTFMPIGAVVR